MPVKCGVCGKPGANPCVSCAKATKKLIEDLKKPEPKKPDPEKKEGK